LLNTASGKPGEIKYAKIRSGDMFFLQVFQVLGRSLNQSATLTQKEEQAVRTVWALSGCQLTSCSGCWLGASRTCGGFEVKTFPFTQANPLVGS